MLYTVRRKLRKLVRCSSLYQSCFLNSSLKLCLEKPSSLQNICDSTCILNYRLRMSVPLGWHCTASRRALCPYCQLFIMFIQCVGTFLTRKYTMQVSIILHSCLKFPYRNILKYIKIVSMFLFLTHENFLKTLKKWLRVHHHSVISFYICIYLS